MKAFQISVFYSFFNTSELMSQGFEKKLQEKGLEHDIKGLFILSPEGLNFSFSSDAENVEKMKTWLQDFTKKDFPFQDSQCDFNPFRRFKTTLRDEIITYDKNLNPHLENNTHLSSKMWHQALENEDVTVIDTRNYYETKIGRFKNALIPDIKNFQDFSEWLDKKKLNKKKKTLLYCTGGVRCEKAVLEMKEKGFHDVYQLKGGIISYLKSFPHENFEGECFVFDHRVAVDQKLKPSSQYFLCTQCGDPADQKIPCKQCEKKEYVCVVCLEKNDESFQTCSKNCQYHFRMKHSQQNIHKDSEIKRIKPF